MWLCTIPKTKNGSLRTVHIMSNLVSFFTKLEFSDKPEVFIILDHSEEQLGVVMMSTEQDKNSENDAKLLFRSVYDRSKYLNTDDSNKESCNNSERAHVAASHNNPSAFAFVSVETPNNRESLNYSKEYMIRGTSQSGSKWVRQCDFAGQSRVFWTNDNRSGGQKISTFRFVRVDPDSVKCTSNNQDWVACDFTPICDTSQDCVERYCTYTGTCAHCLPDGNPTSIPADCCNNKINLKGECSDCFDNGQPASDRSECCSGNISGSMLCSECKDDTDCRNERLECNEFGSCVPIEGQLEGEECDDEELPCSDELKCYNDICQGEDCMEEDESCSSDEECCFNYKCYRNTCVPEECLELNESCEISSSECCGSMGCYTDTSTGESVCMDEDPAQDDSDDENDDENVCETNEDCQDEDLFCDFRGKCMEKWKRYMYIGIIVVVGILLLGLVLVLFFKSKK